ncbi:MAG TPA: D-2-hydroxyacid dehydrogenase [Actinomycetota bacterium]
MTDPIVVLIAGASPDAPPPGLRVDPAAVALRFAPDEDAMREGMAVAEVLFPWGARRRWISDAWPTATRLRWIQSPSDGVDRLLFPELVASDVIVTNSRGVFDDAIGEWAIAAFLSFATGLYRSTVDTGTRTWQDGRSRRRVAGSTLCVLGPGPIGRAAARRVRDLGIHVTAVGRAPRSDELFGRIGGPEDLHRLLAEADFVLDALPGAPGTAGYVDAEAFAAMKPGAIFANIGRGRTVDEVALDAALRAGHLGGAALDVFAREPLAEDSPLWTAPNVIVSPHVCGDVEGWEEEVVSVFLDNLERYRRGEPLRNLVDKEAGFGVGDADA